MPIKDIVLASHDNDAWYWAHSQVCIQLVIRYCMILLITCINTGKVQVLDIDTRSNTPPRKVLPIDHRYSRSCYAHVCKHKHWAVFAYHRDVASYTKTSIDCTRSLLLSISMSLLCCYSSSMYRCVQQSKDVHVNIFVDLSGSNHNPITLTLLNKTSRCFSVMAISNGEGSVLHIVVQNTSSSRKQPSLLEVNLINIGPSSGKDLLRHIGRQEPSRLEADILGNDDLALTLAGKLKCASNGHAGHGLLRRSDTSEVKALQTEVGRLITGGLESRGAVEPRAQDVLDGDVGL
jgi:hypothetical protein